MNAITIASVLLLAVTFTTFILIQNLDNQFSPKKASVSGKSSEKPMKISRYPAAENVIKGNRIFFHETSGTNYLNFRQLCAVESAALHNPDRPIQVFLHTTQQVNPCSAWLDIIRKYSNIEILLLNETAFFSGTLLEEWYLNFTRHPPENREFYLSKYVRILSSLKGGGTYSDLDYIYIRPIEVEQNFFAFDRANDSKIEGHVFKMSSNHTILSEIAREMTLSVLTLEVEPLSQAINKILPKYCSFGPNVTFLPSKTYNCSDFTILPYHLFCPTPLSDLSRTLYFLKEEEVKEFTENGTIGIHLWAQQSDRVDLKFDSSTVFTRLPENNCPLTVTTARKLDKS